MYYEGLDANDKANKAALLLAYTRYTSRLAPFVKGSSRRLAYVQDKVDSLLEECALETDAELDYLKDRFSIWLRESVPSKLPADSYQIKNEDSGITFEKTDIMEHGEVEGAGREEAINDGVEKQDLSEYTLPLDSLQPTAAALIKKAMTAKDFVLIASVLSQNNADPALVEAFADALSHTNDMFSRERFIAAASGNPLSGRDAPRPMPGDSGILGKCARCDADLDAKIASETDVCMKCTRELLAKTKKSDAMWSEQGTSLGQPNYNDPSNGIVAPNDPNMQYTCTICGRTGTKDEITQHVNQDHADVLQRQHQLEPQTQQQPYPMAAVTKEGKYVCVNCGTDRTEDDLSGDGRACPKCGFEATKDGQLQVKKADVTDGQNPAVVEPLQETPGDHFQDIVSDLASQAAARHFSLPTQDQIHTVSSQLGLPYAEVENALVSIATFGNYTGVNGELGGDGSPPDGYEAIQAQAGSNAPQTAKVPTNLVVQKVAEDMNLEPDLAYSMIRDKYGADLPTTYHAQVQGQQTFYLPSQLAQNQQQQDQVPQPQNTDPNVGPAFQQTPPGAPVQQAPAQTGIPQQQ